MLDINLDIFVSLRILTSHLCKCPLSGMVWLDTRDCDGGVDDGTHVASPLLITLYSLAHLTLATTQRWVHSILFYWRDNQGAERRQILLQTLFSWHVNCLPHLDSTLGESVNPRITQFSPSSPSRSDCCSHAVVLLVSQAHGLCTCWLICHALVSYTLLG